METVLLVAVLLIAVKLVADLGLDYLNLRSVNQHAHAVPEEFASFIGKETYAKSVDYTRAKIRFGLVETLFDAVWLAVVLISGLLPWLWSALGNAEASALWQQVLSLMLILFLLGLPGIPFSLYGQFRLEERFGFNKMTLGLWVSDRIKGMILALVLGFPLLWLVLWLVGLSPLWWLYAFAGFFVFQLLMIVIYPNYIMPLFNKFTELPDGELRDRLLALGQRTGFNARTILVMDGSKRSGHSNAFFAGFGKLRRIVLFDTLIEQLSPRQLEAVLAHEIGHYKLGHIPKMIALSALSLLGSFALMGWLVQSPWFVEGFGFDHVPGQLAPTLLLFMLLSSVLTFWLTPLTNSLSRKHEFEADAYAKQAMDGSAEPLIESLRILSEKNLSNLTPHKLYSAFHYSHPTLLERERAMRNA